ncbi:MAG: hypothetical protein IPK19_23050 [Chloroflexi bacterium]|nr:hypothetical protein [Chloroflexota bacterium]
MNPFFRHHYCAFKGADKGLAAFGIKFGEGGHLFLYIKRVHDEATGFPIRYERYVEYFDQVEYAMELGGSDLKVFLPLLKLACERSS